MSASTYAARRDRLRSALADEEPDATLLVTHLPNVRYLTGFSGSNAVLAIGPDPRADVLGTDGRYVDQVAAEAPDLATLIDRDTLRATCTSLQPGRVAIEGTASVGDLTTVRSVRGEPSVIVGSVETLRRVKEPGEIDLLARACAITVEAMAQLAREMRPGVSERLLARRLEQLFGDLGADDRAFDTIVGSGPNSAIPHHQPGSRLLEPGDLVVVDAGARVEGYHADMTRTFVVATGPSAWQTDVHDVVQRAQEAARAGYRAGADARGLDGLAREVVDAAGLSERFTHGLGHGVGLEIHEAPMIGARATGTIENEMVITVEPGVYLPGRGGVRIEDTLVVADGGPRVLTEAPRDLCVVG